MFHARLRGFWGSLLEEKQLVSCAEGVVVWLRSTVVSGGGMLLMITPHLSYSVAI